MQWHNSTLDFYSVLSLYVLSSPQCAYLKIKWFKVGHLHRLCHTKSRFWTFIMCESNENHFMNEPSPPDCSTVVFNITTPQLRRICPREHATQTFLACDKPSAFCSINFNDTVIFSESRETWALPTTHLCGMNMTSPPPPSFACTVGDAHVPYTLVCDFRQDCLDNSDEDFCDYPDCVPAQQFQCESQQCIGFEKLCDDVVDCLDQTDEMRCNKEYQILSTNHPPAIVTLDGRGSFTATKLPSLTAPCPDTHFKCLTVEFCMPVYVRCNGVNDCPGEEDEEGCDDGNRTCPGFYHCRATKIFLHPLHLCDGWSQCPQHDDERFCNLPCPAQCSCLGHSWFCRHIFRAKKYPMIRFLDAKNSGMKPSGLTNELLIHLSLSKCGVVDFKFFNLPNLRSLDLEGNRIRIVTTTNLKRLPNLNTLFLSGNPLTSQLILKTKHYTLSGNPLASVISNNLVRLDLSDVKIKSFNSSFLASFPKLQTLNLSGCGIDKIVKPAAFRVVPQLRVLDIRGCRLLSFPTGMLKPLTRLHTVRADNFKLCCAASLPGSFYSRTCESPVEQLSSCDDLFKSNLHRVSWNMATYLSLLCNLAMLVKRLLNDTSRPCNSKRSGQKFAVDAFVTSLFVSGCLHAVYMVTVGLADALYRGSYVVKDTDWKYGPLCTAAGFIWLLSMELSLCLVCLITLDRVLVSWHPLKLGCFCWKSAVRATCVVVVGGGAIAVVPLIQSPSLFQETALCSPLLLASQKIHRGQYLYGVFFVFNVTVSWLAAFGQLSMHIYLHKKMFAFVQSPNQTKELSTTRRVMAVVLCDIMYWLVIGHNSYFVAAGMSLPDDVVLAAQVLVMPFAWTLKPVLHVVAALREHRRRDREERILKILLAKRHD